MATQLTLTSLDFFVCATTLVGSMLVGLWLGMRKTTKGSSDGFFLAGRQLTWPIVGRIAVRDEHRRGTSGWSVGRFVSIRSEGRHGGTRHGHLHRHRLLVVVPDLHSDQGLHDS